MVNEVKMFQAEGGATQQQVDDHNWQIEAMRAEVQQAQELVNEARQVLADASAHTSGLERELNAGRLKDFNARKCSLEYCTNLKLTPQEGGVRSGTCRHHSNLIASIVKKSGVKSKVAWKYVASNEIDADVLRRARVDKDQGAKCTRIEYLGSVEL